METYIIKTSIGFKDFCVKLRPIFSFDCETTSLNYLDLELIGFSISDGVQACYVEITEDNKRDILEVLDFYLGEAKIIVMQNAPYDMCVLHKEGIEI
jgi:DNA polymerase I-like protein with 3'-5' exonuclease and polymerase domains